MYRLFTTKPVLESIWNLGEKCEWYSVLQKTDLSEIFIPEDFTINVDGSMGVQDELSAISQYIQVTPKSKHLEYCKKREDSEFIKCVDKLTNALFLVEDSFNEADFKYIGERMGIYCQRFSDSEKNLFAPIKYYPMKKNEKDFSWPSFFSTLKTIPTKSAIICDRNLFSNDYQNGCENLKLILKDLIVGGRCTDFSFLVFFEKFSDDHQEKKNEEKKNDILNDLNTFLTETIVYGGLPLINVKIALVSVSRNNSHFEITHDRNIGASEICVGKQNSFLARFA